MGKKYSELDVINGAVDDIMGGRPLEDAIGEIGSAVDSAISKHRAQDEQLRELLSYCRSTGYGDVADRLTAILDGEQ